MTSESVRELVEKEIAGEWSLTNAHGCDLQRCLVSPELREYEDCGRGRPWCDPNPSIKLWLILEEIPAVIKSYSERTAACLGWRRPVPQVVTCFSDSTALFAKPIAQCEAHASQGAQPAPLLQGGILGSICFFSLSVTWAGGVSDPRNHTVVYSGFEPGGGSSLRCDILSRRDAATSYFSEEIAALSCSSSVWPTS